MQKNDAGFKMQFRKRNPDFRRPSKKTAAPSIPASGDLGKHDKPTRAIQKSHEDMSSSSSEEDILESKRKEELENQRSEQAKLVEMALLEQVMNGQLDVMELLKSGQADSNLKEKLQQKMLDRSVLDGVPTSERAPSPPPAQKAHATDQGPFNPLMRTHRSDPGKGANVQPASQPKRPSSKQRKKVTKSTGSISSESSESSSESSSDISSESDSSDDDSHKLTKRVKKLKAQNKKLTKKVKVLKKKLKDAKKTKPKDDNSSSSSKSVQRNSHGQIVEPKAAPLILKQKNAGANVPMTPQQFAAQQSQLRKQYDPQTGQYRNSQAEIVSPVSLAKAIQTLTSSAPPTMPSLPPMPMGHMPQMPPMPFGQMPAMPLGQMPMFPPPMPVVTSDYSSPFPSTSAAGGPTESHPCEDDTNEIKVVSVKNVKDPNKNFLSDDDLYLDVFMGKEKKEKPAQSPAKPVPSTSTSVPNRKINQTRESQPIQQIPTSSSQRDHYAPSSGPSTDDVPMFSQPQDASHHYATPDPPPVAIKPKKPVDSSSDSESDSENSLRKRKGSSGEVIVRSEAAKKLIQGFYEDEADVNIVGGDTVVPGDQKASTDTPESRGVTFSGKCIFCNLYHTVSGEMEPQRSLCTKGRMYIEKYRDFQKKTVDARNFVKEQTDRMIKLKNKRELMMKILTEDVVRRDERAARMEKHRLFIENLPEPVKVSQEFGRKVVEAQTRKSRAPGSYSRDDSGERQPPLKKATPEPGLDYRRNQPRRSSETEYQNITPVKERRPVLGSQPQDESGYRALHPARGGYSNRGGHRPQNPPRMAADRGPPNRDSDPADYTPLFPVRSGVAGRGTSHSFGPPEGSRQSHDYSIGHPAGQAAAPDDMESLYGPAAAGRGSSIGRGVLGRGAPPRGPPQSRMEGAPAAAGPPRSRLGGAPAAGPPRRPPPAALLQTPGPRGPDPGSQRFQNPGNRPYTRLPANQGWSGARGR